MTKCWPALIFAAIVATTPAGAQEIPENAHSASNVQGWACNQGYLQASRECISVATAPDSIIRQILVRRSVSSYSGSCACPYNRDSAGRRCGGRSAYSRPGGAAPLCYERNVSDAQVRRFREANSPDHR